MKVNNLLHPTAEKPGTRSVPKFRDVGVGCAVLMPHAPILVAGVGGERSGAAEACRQAMRAAASTVVSLQPETLVLISPHSPRQLRAFGVWADDPLQGSFAQFDAPQIEVSLPVDAALARAIASEMHARDWETWTIRHCPLDHGALVPLWFLVEAGWAGPMVILSLNYSGGDGLTIMGEAIAAAAHELPRRIAVIASGDMSHRLAANAPCGFHPQAHVFDEKFIQLVRAGTYRKIQNMSPELRELAAEDVVDSTLIAASAVNWQTDGHQMLHYEGPFGVGYGVAILFAEKIEAKATKIATKKTARKSEGTVLPGLARRAVETALSGSLELPPAPMGEYLNNSRGVFVTICHRNGALRGCMGTIAPVCPDVVAETWRSARLAALQDNRFSPVTADELPALQFDVSVLHAPEKVATEADLDPRRFGVIVSAEDGRRGLLLPGIKEIKTPAEQVNIARQKGWINADEPITLQRFQVDHFEEPAG